MKLNIFTEYAQSINVVLLISILGILASVVAILIRLQKRFNELNKEVLSNKDGVIEALRSEISLLEKQKEDSEKNSVLEFNSRLSEYEKYFKSVARLEANEWLDNSKKSLVESAKSEMKTEYESISEEIKKREFLFENIDYSNKSEFIKPETLEGVYRVLGSNQSIEENNGYIGYLKLKLDKNKRIFANWIIGGEQAHSGKGFYKDNILVINFSYKGEKTGKIFKGVVVYRFLNQNILKGFWSEKFGRDDSLGYEECRRLEEIELDSININ